MHAAAPILAANQPPAKFPATRPAGAGTAELSFRPGHVADAPATAANSSDASGTDTSAEQGAAAGLPASTLAKAEPTVASDTFAQAGVGVLGPVTATAAPANSPASTMAHAVPAVDHDSTDIEHTAASGSGGINMARVLDTVQGSELRVGMRTAEFGNVSVSTSVSRDQIDAQISFDRGELGKLLATHLPGIEEKLGSETGLHATVQVLERASTGAGSESSHSGSQSGSQSGWQGSAQSGFQSGTQSGSGAPSNASQGEVFRSAGGRQTAGGTAANDTQIATDMRTPLGHGRELPATPPAARLDVQA